MSSIATACVFATGAGVLIALVRWLQPAVSRRAALSYLALVTLLFLPVVSGLRVLVPTDIAYQYAPWRTGATEVVAPQNPLLVDLVLQVLPFHALARGRLLGGEWPLWASELGTGQPLLGNAQSAPFAPLFLLSLPLPPLAATGVIAAWKVLLALLFMHGLLLRLGAPSAGAALAALAFALAPFSIAWLGWPIMSVAMGLPGVVLALVLLGGDAAARRRGFWGLTATALAMALGGHPETLALCALAAAAAGAWIFTRLYRRGAAADAYRFLGRAGLAALLVALLAAPAILPFLHALPLGARAALLRAQRDDARQGLAEFPPAVLATVVQPYALGMPRDDRAGATRNFNELSTAYAGLLPLALVLAAALALERRFAIGIALALAILATAFSFPGLRELWLAVPVLGEAPPGRLRLLWLFAVALGAGLAVGRLAATRRTRLVTVGVSSVVFLTAACVAPLEPSPWPTAAWCAALVSLVAAAVCLLREPWRRWFPWVAMVGLALELVPFAARYEPRLDARRDLTLPAALDVLRPADAALFRVLAPGGEWPANLPALAGLWDPRGNDPMRPAAADRLVALRLSGVARPRQDLHWSRLADRAMVDFLGVRYVVAAQRRLPGDWQTVARDGDLRVFENAHAFPLFFVPLAISRVSATSAFARTAALEDFKALAVIADEDAQGSEVTVAQAGEVTDLRSGANEFVLRVQSAAGAWVASSVSFDPGWRAWIDGAPATVVPIDTGFLGVHVPAGEHRVELRYRPVAWSVGCAAFVLGVALALAVLWTDRRRVPPAAATGA